MQAAMPSKIAPNRALGILKVRFAFKKGYTTAWIDKICYACLQLYITPGSFPSYLIWPPPLY